MTRIATNSLTGWAVALLVCYLIATAVVPGLWLAVSVRIALLLAGVAALMEWGPSAFNLLKERRGPEASRGEILSLLGIATISLGVVYSSLWGIAWYVWDTPTDWTATGHSMFGTYLTAIGLGLVYRSTDIKREVVRPVNWWVIVAVMIVVAAASFVAGAKFTSREVRAEIRLAEAACPVAVSQRGICHTLSSPYRAQVRPVRCFPTVAAAKAAGARAPG